VYINHHSSPTFGTNSHALALKYTPAGHARGGARKQSGGYRDLQDVVWQVTLSNNAINQTVQATCRSRIPLPEAGVPCYGQTEFPGLLKSRIIYDFPNTSLVCIPRKPKAQGEDISIEEVKSRKLRLVRRVVCLRRQ
jgi:hypothetical protein